MFIIITIFLDIRPSLQRRKVRGVPRSMQGCACVGPFDRVLGDNMVGRSVPVAKTPYFLLNRAF